MQKYIFITSIVCFLLCGSIFNCKAKSQEAEVNPVRKIFLSGSLPVPRCELTQPVEVYQTDYTLEMYFLSSFTSLTITVKNEQNHSVHDQTVDVDEGDCIVIDTSQWALGVYTLLIADGLGNSMEGEFEIE